MSSSSWCMTSHLVGANHIPKADTMTESSFNDYWCFMLLFKNEDDVICIFQINEVLVSNQMHTWILEIRACTFHYFINDEIN